ncbi:MAG: TonB-dependent receptor [Flavobacteriales bacterium]|nr:TonB-dependent receptor [Flavobacteriales bacterium]
MLKKIIGLLLLQGLSLALWSQESVSGVVISEDKKGRFNPIPYANVYWMDSNYGTTTDSNGVFNLAIPDNARFLIASFVGYSSDTLEVRNFSKTLTLKLGITVELSAVEIEARRKSTEMSFMNPINSENISQRELFKAACCNLSESFETNPSVDVNFTDAISGNRQIRMLGLDGPYTLISRENMPGIRGLGNAFGLTFIPGVWVESIQLTKGIGSVVNGYESIAGQINFELKKPEVKEETFVNLYANQGGRMEVNFIKNQKVNEKWSTALLLHGNMRPFERDMNSDGFRDFPLQEQINVMNRWKYDNGKGLMAQIGFHYVNDEKEGGETDQREDELSELGRNALYRLKINTEKAEVFTKTGIVFPSYKYRSMGLQMSASFIDQESFYGLRDYDAREETFYANYIYQSIIGSSFHKFKAGMSFLYDDFDERLDDLEFNRTERVPGAFFEYTFEPSANFTLVAGARWDEHNIYGGFFTPRIHLRYASDEYTVFRLLAGSGQRTANVIAERQSLLASSRSYQFLGQNADYPFGIPMERAWNYGFNVLRNFTIDYRDGYVSLDLYRTEFENQLVADRDESSSEVLFYNLEGESYANNLQFELSYELIKFLEMRAAYRFTEVRTEYRSGLRQKPFTPKHRWFVNLAYSTAKSLKGANWTFDLTTQWFGEQRIPTTANNPVEYQRGEMSPSFFTFNAQVTRNFNDRWSLYAGMENIMNYRQDDPIISSENPFGNNFDASMIWGPIFGRMVYGGLRMTLGKAEM